MRLVGWGAVALAGLPSGVVSTSMKIDYLKMADVRTDPIVNPEGPSKHIHSFFGAQVAAPDATYADLRAAQGNTGNVEENLSLYWHPTIYRWNKKEHRAEIQETSLFSTYYIWKTGETTAFPDGFKMIGGGKGYGSKAMPYAECVDRGRCPNNNCERWNTFFPAQACAELEMSMRMPSCWDGKNLDSPDHRSHVAYPEDSDPENPCPASHPVRLPQIRMFTRIMPYRGGIHFFSDGTGHFHADYFSGWDSSELQVILDSCENESFDAMPTDWCEDFATFRDAPKNPDSTIVDEAKLLAFQPPALDVSSILDEEIDYLKTSLPGEVAFPAKKVGRRVVSCGTIGKYRKIRSRRTYCLRRADCVYSAAQKTCTKLLDSIKASPITPSPTLAPTKVPCRVINAYKKIRWRRHYCLRRTTDCEYIASKKQCRDVATEPEKPLQPLHCSYYDNMREECRNHGCEYNVAKVKFPRKKKCSKPRTTKAFCNQFHENEEKCKVFGCNFKENLRCGCSGVHC